jgi:hypothetical protein
MLWKFARESAFAAGTASNIEIVLRRISKYLVFKTRKQILKKKGRPGRGVLGDRKIDRSV